MHLNLARFRTADSARFTHSHGPLTSRIIFRNLSQHVKKTSGFVNIAKKAKIARWKVFFQPELSLSQFRTDLNSSLAWSAGELRPFRKGMFSSPDWGLEDAEIFTNFWCFVHNFGYRYARKSFKGSKDCKLIHRHVWQTCKLYLQKYSKGDRYGEYADQG